MVCDAGADDAIDTVLTTRYNTEHACTCERVRAHTGCVRLTATLTYYSLTATLNCYRLTATLTY